MLTIEDIELYQAFSPFLKCCVIFGLFHHNKNNSVDNAPVECFSHDESKTKKKWTSRCTFSKCYSLGLIIFMACNNIRLLSMFEKEDKFGFVLFTKIIFSLWFLNGTFTVISAYLTSSQAETFFMEWNKIQEQFKANSKNKQDYKKLTFSVLIVCIILILINMTLGTYSIYHTTNLDCMLAPFKPEDLSSVGDKLLRAFAVVTAAFTNGAWISHIGLFFLASKYLPATF